MGLLPRQLPVLAGEILLEGEDLARASEARLRALRCVRTSMIFQEPMTALNPVMRCGEQIEEVLLTHTRLDAGARRRRVRQAIEEVGLPDPERMQASYPHQLSGGQRQRIMIAMALILEPVLLIADEPTTALDVTVQAQILQLIEQLQAEFDAAVVVITHDLGVVAEMADRVVVLRLGELVEAGSKHEVLTAPGHPYTKMLIGAVPGVRPAARASDDSAPLVLRTEGLTKVYSSGGFLPRHHEVRAATKVSLQIRRGQTLGIVGESGSGKSTVARCIARLIDPTSGRVELGGEDIATMPHRKLRPLRRRMQIIFQDPYRSLNPRRSVGESVIEGPLNYGVARAEAMARARELMELVRLDPASLDRYPHQFSGGQRQRLCIARALAMDPELLIADE
ncbi:MAG: ATP-binding cassette domain-containing protein, partial [Gammaproteobacteria bacterium]